MAETNVQWLHEKVKSEQKILEACNLFLKATEGRVALYKFWAVKLLHQNADELLSACKAFAESGLYFTLFSVCQRIATQGLASVYNTLKIESHDLWDNLGRIRSPLPDGDGHAIQFNKIIGVIGHVVTLTVLSIRTACYLIKERIFFLTSYPHDRRISCASDGTLTTTKSRLGWEMWKSEDSMGAVYLSSVEHDVALSGGKEHEVFTTPTRMGWERWKFEAGEKTGTWYIISATHGLALSCNKDGVLSLQSSRLSWELWTMDTFLPDPDSYLPADAQKQASA